MVVMVLIVLIPAVVFAEAKGSVGVYPNWSTMTEEERDNRSEHQKVEITVTNVVEELKAPNYIFEKASILVAEGSSDVTVMVEDGLIFNVYELVKIDNEYIYYNDTELPVTGDVEVYLPGEDDSFIIDIKDIDEYKDEDGFLPFYTYAPGCKVALTEPGEYYVDFGIEAREFTNVVVVVKDSKAEEQKSPEKEQVEAKPSGSNVLVNGEKIGFEAYNIKGNNYFKLRDIAEVVSGTEKQFDVTWYNELKVIYLQSNKEYISIGGELTEGDGKAKVGTLNTSKILKDEEKIELTAYLINDNNYFKLRDLAAEFNIGLTYDEKTQTVGIDTSIGYTE